MRRARDLNVLSGWLCCALLCAGGARAQDALDELPDPMRPQYSLDGNARPAPAKKAVALELQSTIVSEGRRLAVINGRTVGVGATVYGARVKAVEPYEVWVERDGRDFSLKLVTRSVVEHHPGKEHDGETE